MKTSDFNDNDDGMYKLHDSISFSASLKNVGIRIKETVGDSHLFTFEATAKDSLNLDDKICAENPNEPDCTVLRVYYGE